MRPRHALHGGVVLAVLIQLGFAAAFLVDAAQANRTYDALAAQRVMVTAKTVGCFFLGPSRSGASYGEVCRVAYSYSGHYYSAVIDVSQTRTFYVDPHDPAISENVATYRHGPEETGGDLMFAVLLLFGAALVTTVHQLHLHRVRGMHRRFGQSGAGVWAAKHP